MGLCKCPKKKVTNLFCFEHRVNVCEHCLVSNHPNCIVQSYLQWLQDSDYDPNCRLCGKSLSDDTSGPCVRLTCYDVFHWQCLNNYAHSLPPNTAPAGYSCPICKSAIFPGQNLVSPVADKLKDSLSQVNWARSGLGLPLIEDTTTNQSVQQTSTPEQTTVPTTASHIPATAVQKSLAQSFGVSSPPQPQPSTQQQQQQSKSNPVAHSVINVGGEDAMLYARSDKTDSYKGDPRKLFDSTKEERQRLLDMSHDHDVDKYKRRPALQWFSRWFQSRTNKHQRQDPNATLKRFAIVLVIGIIGFLTVVVIFTRVGRASADSDPFLDPMANPNIRVNQ